MLYNMTVYLRNAYWRTWAEKHNISLSNSVAVAYLLNLALETIPKTSAPKVSTVQDATPTAISYIAILPGKAHHYNFASEKYSLLLL
jgi:hypothetical protein